MGVPTSVPGIDFTGGHPIKICQPISMHLKIFTELLLKVSFCARGQKPYPCSIESYLQRPYSLPEVSAPHKSPHAEAMN